MYMQIFPCLCFTSSPGPSQNPVGLQQPPGVGPGMTQQPTYSPMQAKSAAPPGSGLYLSGPYQPVLPSSSYQPGPTPTSYLSPLGPPLLTRPAMGSPLPHTPPHSATPSPGPRMPPAQPTPPPPAVSSSTYYPNPQQPQAWQYNTTLPPTYPPNSTNAPPRGPLGNHVTPATSSSLPPPPPSSAYSSEPPAHTSHSTAQPPGPRMPPTSAHGFIQQGQSSTLPCSKKMVKYLWASEVLLIRNCILNNNTCVCMMKSCFISLIIFQWHVLKV